MELVRTHKDIKITFCIFPSYLFNHRNANNDNITCQIRVTDHTGWTSPYIKTYYNKNNMLHLDIHDDKWIKSWKPIVQLFHNATDNAPQTLNPKRLLLLIPKKPV